MLVVNSGDEILSSINVEGFEIVDAKEAMI
jgi:hypothetical protein